MSAKKKSKKSSVWCPGRTAGIRKDGTWGRGPSRTHYRCDSGTEGDENGKLKALIFDSKYDNYLGVIIYARIKDGSVKKGDIIRLMATNKKYEVTEVGICAPNLIPTKQLKAGEVGYICASIKQVADARVGDTITLDADPADEPLPGYKKVQSMVYCGIYPAKGKNTRA